MPSGQLRAPIELPPLLRTPMLSHPGCSRPAPAKQRAPCHPSASSRYGAQFSPMEHGLLNNEDAARKSPAMMRDSTDARQFSHFMITVFHLEELLLG
ncbi:hypothetical protein KIN20_004249 [Parelaphostrongylus tenuis]|uniref:Uncharacterized protein n=1 Tax=Parelaphostrongylus tenuis TaxID=148309 RepID=A0AAD5MJI0_PARTN|nr:hypothetical protein KIN20_004249 [Parelaphostrongylus tenuis]